MRKAKKTPKEEPCSRRQKLAKESGVPVKIAEIALIGEKDDDMVLALLLRLKAAKACLTPEERANAIKMGLLDRIAFIKKKLGEGDANLMKCGDVMISHTIVVYLSQEDE